MLPVESNPGQTWTRHATIRRMFKSGSLLYASYTACGRATGTQAIRWDGGALKGWEIRRRA